MVVLLGRTLGIRRWVSLVILTLGVSIVSLPSANSKDSILDIHDFSDHFFPRSVHELGQFAGGVAEAARELTKRSVTGLVTELARRSATYEGIKEDQDTTELMMSYSVGVTAVVVAALVSGLTGVYFEKVLKDSASPASIWTRNIQLSFYSLFPALFVGVIYNDGAEIAKHGFFDGYNGIVWTAIVLQSVSGLLASICINYADNIAKNFATSISIVISFVFSVFFFNFEMTSSVCYPLECHLENTALTLYSSLSGQCLFSRQLISTAFPSPNGPVHRPLALRATRRPLWKGRQDISTRID